MTVRFRVRLPDQDGGTGGKFNAICQADTNTDGVATCDHPVTIRKPASARFAGNG